jgi:hypothetical protein
MRLLPYLGSSNQMSHAYDRSAVKGECAPTGAEGGVSRLATARCDSWPRSLGSLRSRPNGPAQLAGRPMDQSCEAAQTRSGCSGQRGRLLSSFLTCRVMAGGMTKRMTSSPTAPTLPTRPEWSTVRRYRLASACDSVGWLFEEQRGSDVAMVWPRRCGDGPGMLPPAAPEPLPVALGKPVTAYRGSASGLVS